MLRKNNITVLLLSAVLISAFCKKEKEYAPYPYHAITGFTVASGEEKLSAAITEDSVVLYWPSWESVPSSISPEISISENASIIPASGESVELKDGFAWTVKAQDGTTKKYFLKLVINQPDIWINAVSFGHTQGTEKPLEILAYSLRYIIPDPAKTRVWLVDAANKEYEFPVSFPPTYNGYPNRPVMVLAWPATNVPPIGAYRLKITSGVRTKITEQAQYAILNSVFPQATPVTTAITVRRGETITFSGKDFTEMKDASVKSYNDNWFEVEIAKLTYVSHTATEAVYRVPANFPLGTFKLGDYTPNTGISIGLETSEFFSGWNYAKPKQQWVNVPGPADITITD